MTLIEDLKKKYGAQRVSPYGEVVVVPNRDFKETWVPTLNEAGYGCKNLLIAQKPYTVIFQLDVASEPPQNLKSPKWTPETEKELLEIYDRLTAKGIYYGAVTQTANAAVKEPSMKNRSVDSIKQKLDKLLKKRKRQRKKETAQTEKTTEPDIHKLQMEVAELRKECEDLRDFVQANLAVKHQIGKLTREFKQHKHAIGSGETVLPV